MQVLILPHNLVKLTIKGRLPSPAHERAPHRVPVTECDGPVARQLCVDGSGCVSRGCVPIAVLWCESPYGDPGAAVGFGGSHGERGVFLGHA